MIFRGLYTCIQCKKINLIQVFDLRGKDAICTKLRGEAKSEISSPISK